MANALLFQDLLDPFDGVSFIVKQMTDTLEQIDIVWAIIAAATASFHGLYLRKAGFPKAQNMLRQVEILRDLANCSECIRTFPQDTHLSLATSRLAEIEKTPPPEI